MQSTTLGGGDLASAASERTRFRIPLRDSAPLFVLSLCARFLALRFSTIESGDSAARVWLGWRWLDHPFFMTDGVWGPLHFYLIGGALFLWPDPVWGPTLLHVVMGASVPVAVYGLSREIFDDRRSALLAGTAAAVYPTAVAISVVAASETPFVLFLSVGMLFIARTRASSSAVRDPLVAGLAIGLASMLRYEAWMLLPFLTLLLIRRPAQAALFLGVALVHPVVWMAGNYLAHGDPLFSFAWAARYERDLMGHAEAVTLTGVARTIGRLVWTIQRGLSLPLSALALVGIAGSLRRREGVAVWLLLPAGLFVLYVVAAARGSLLLKWEYTVTYGILLMPLVAESSRVLGMNRWSRPRFVGTMTLLVLAVGLSAYEPAWQVLPGRRFFFADATPGFFKEAEAKRVLELVNAGRATGHDAAVIDFFGWSPSAYVALHTGLHPSRLCKTSGAPNINLDPADFARFVAANPKGVMITRDHGRLDSMLQRKTDEVAQLDDLLLRISPVGVVPWTTAPGGERESLHVDRYELISGSTGTSRRGGRCISSCVPDFCADE